MTAREAMEAYARKHVRIADEIQIGAVHVKHARLDEVAGKAFTALGLVLTITEELIEDAKMPLDPELESGNVDAVMLGKQHQAALAELIEKVIEKGLEA